MTGPRLVLGAALLLAPCGWVAAQVPRIDGLVEQAIHRGDIPGAVVLVGQEDRVLHRAAYGHRQVRPQKKPMRVDTLFDLASLTKPMATATSIFVLAERGRLKLDDPVARHLPAFAASGKARITIEQLLRHEGGLAPANHMREYADGAKAALQRIEAAAPRWPPGSRFAYSDLGYIVLGRLVERRGGEPLHVFARRLLFAPMGMARTSFLPPAAWRDNCAATGQRDGKWMVGQVHDPRAFALGGVAGHAGLFGTADDVGRFCRTILGNGAIEGRRVLRPQTVAAMLRPRPLPAGAGLRSGAFDVDTAYSSPRGLRFERGRGGGHSGFTGTCFWIDPATRTYLVFLSNRVHPGGGRSITDLYRAIATAAAEAALGPAPGAVVGIDMLRRTNYAELEGRRVGLITNHTGRSRDGSRTIDLLHKSRHVKLVKIFSPEHGLLGKLDEKVGHGVDKATGLKVYSLYGASRRPKPEWLTDIDTLVFDIQDVGTRFYTYITTMGYAMEEAARHGRRFVVLDRPNPIAPLGARGPLADADRLSFIAYRPLPLTHGLTVGELARWFNTRLDKPCDLQVVAMGGWNRQMWWDQVAQPWVNPSPNLRNPTQAVLYPAIGLLEASNLSVGRGTDEPFERIGAPWIDPGREGHLRLAAALNVADLPGLRFAPIVFAPASSKFAGETCGGVHVILTDRRRLRPARSGLTIAWHLRRLFPQAFHADDVLRMLGNRQAHDAWKSAPDPAKLSGAWDDQAQAFWKRVGPHRLYD